MFRTRFTKCWSKLSMSIYCYCFKVTFLVIWLLKPKWCFGNKFMAFQHFSSKPLLLAMGVFNESFLCIFGLSGFLFFAIEHYSETRKPMKIFISSFFEVLRPFNLFRALFKWFFVFKIRLSKCCSKLSTKPSIGAESNFSYY